MQTKLHSLASPALLVAAVAVLSGCGLTKDKIVTRTSVVYEDRDVIQPTQSQVHLMFSDIGKSNSIIESLKDDKSGSYYVDVEAGFETGDDDGNGDDITSLQFSASRSNEGDKGAVINVDFEKNSVQFLASSKTIIMGKKDGEDIVLRVEHKDIVDDEIILSRLNSESIAYNDDTDSGRKGTRYTLKHTKDNGNVIAMFANRFEYLDDKGSEVKDADIYTGGYWVELKENEDGDPVLANAGAFSDGDNLDRIIKGYVADAADTDDKVLWYDGLNTADLTIDSKPQEIVASYGGQTDGAYSRQMGTEDATGGGFWGDIELNAKINSGMEEGVNVFLGTISGNITDIEYADFASIVTSSVSGTSLGSAVTIKLDETEINSFGSFTGDINSDKGNWSGIFSELTSTTAGPSSVYGTYGFEHDKATDDNFFFNGFFGLPRTSNTVSAIPAGS